MNGLLLCINRTCQFRAQNTPRYRGRSCIHHISVLSTSRRKGASRMRCVRYYRCMIQRAAMVFVVGAAAFVPTVACPTPTPIHTTSTPTSASGTRWGCMPVTQGIYNPSPPQVCKFTAWSRTLSIFKKPSSRSESVQHNIAHRNVYEWFGMARRPFVILEESAVSH
jgi:hypothetical protein